MELTKQIEIVTQLLEATKELNGEYQEGWDNDIENGEKLIEHLKANNIQKTINTWASVKIAKPKNCDQVFVKYENGKYGINEWWVSDNCWKYEFDNMIVKEWCYPPN